MKYLVMFLTHLKAAMAYRADTLLSALFSFFRVLSCYLLWRMLIPEGGTLDGFTLPQMVTYSVMTTALVPLNMSGDPINAFADDIRTGKFVRHLTAPVQPFFVFLSSSAASGVPPFVMTAGCCCIWALLFRGMLCPLNAAMLLPALGVLALGCVFVLLLNYLIACLAFRFTEVFGVVLVRGTLMEFFCGYLTPVELLFGAALRWSPLSYLAGYPALLLMDCAAVPPSQAALVLLVWSLALGAVCAVVSRRSRVYFEGVGA